jgi:hypothetical protein
MSGRCSDESPKAIDLKSLGRDFSEAADYKKRYQFEKAAQFLTFDCGATSDTAGSPREEVPRQRQAFWELCPAISVEILMSIGDGRQPRDGFVQEANKMPRCSTKLQACFRYGFLLELPRACQG